MVDQCVDVNVVVPGVDPAQQLDHRRRVGEATVVANRRRRRFSASSVSRSV